MPYFRRLTEDGDYRVLEDGDFRLLENVLYGAVPCEATGEASADASRDAEVTGEAGASDSRSCELHGEGSVSGSIAAEVHGEGGASASRACELAGVLSATASRSAELHGEESVSASRSAEVTGELSDGAARSAELTGEMNHPRTSFANGGGGSWDTVVAVAIDHAKVPSDLTDFQLYVRLSDLGDAFWDAVQDGGADIRVTDIGGVELAREVVSCATATKTGELWVKVPSVSSSDDTVINIYVGDASAYDYAPTDTYGAQAVWGANAKYVGHFEGDADDSSANATTTTVSGAVQATGFIGHGYSFDGADDYVKLANANITSASLKNGFVFQAIINPTSLGENKLGRLIDVQNSSSNRLLWYLESGNTMRYIINVDTPFDSPVAYSLGSFAHVAIKVEADGLVTYYSNGQVIGTPTARSAPSTLAFTHDLFVGCNEATNRAFDGSIDEVRIYAGSKSDESIAAEYANQSDPGTFYAVVRDDSNRSAELHGEDGADANFAAELRGEDTASADVAAEIRGEAGADAARACELAGEVRFDASRHAELHGEGASSASIGAEVSGEAHASAGRSAELRGEDSASGSVAAELHGSLTVSASRDCELHGEDSASGSVACEVVGMTTPYPYVRRPSPYTRYAGH